MRREFGIKTHNIEAKSKSRREASARRSRKAAGRKKKDVRSLSHSRLTTEYNGIINPRTRIEHYVNNEIPIEWLQEFEAAANRSLEVRFRYAFIKTYKPVMDDALFRSFNSMEDYRRWCEENLPRWLGYARV